MVSRIEELLPLVADLTEIGGKYKSLAKLASEDGRSVYHLQRVFSAEVGESPLQLSRRVRLQRAAAALLVTHKSVLDIALDAGFESHEGFCRAFRQRFATSPRKFREQYGQIENQHLETANQTAPCVGLYRISTTEELPTVKGEPSMNYEITKKKITETPFLFMKRQVKPEEISDALASMFVPVFQFATAAGVSFAGRPTARYLSFGPGLVTIVAGMPIESPIEGNGDIKMGVLPGGEVAATMHKGPYDQLNLAHEAIQTWMIENDEEVGGAPWEVYISDPGEVPNPAEWLTEVIHPLK